MNGDHTDRVSTNRSKEILNAYPYHSRLSPNADWTSMVDATKANNVIEQQPTFALTTIKEKTDNTIITDAVAILTPMTERSLRLQKNGQLSPEEEK